MIINSISLIIYIFNVNLIIRNLVTTLINKDCPYLLFHSLTEIIMIYLIGYLILSLLLNYLYFNFKVFQKQNLVLNLMTPCLIFMTIKEMYYLTISLTTQKLMFEFHLYTNLKMIIIISFYIILIKVYLNKLKIKHFFKKNILLNQVIYIFIVIINILPPQLNLYILIFFLIFYNVENNKLTYLKVLKKNSYARGRN